MVGVALFIPNASVTFTAQLIIACVNVVARSIAVLEFLFELCLGSNFLCS